VSGGSNRGTPVNDAPRPGRTFWAILAFAVACGAVAAFVMNVSLFAALTTSAVAGACIGWVVDQRP
jgi:hypothetical protein